MDKIVNMDEIGHNCKYRQNWHYLQNGYVDKMYKIVKVDEIGHNWKHEQNW